MKLWHIKFNKSIILNNFWFKTVSLIIAIIIWVYVSGEITKGVRI